MIKELPEPEFPLSEVLILSYSNIRRRLFRSLITILGIILGITFMSTLITNSVILSILSESQSVESYYWWLVAISLVVCFSGITNSMLMAVNERVKEIGVYKCIGGLDSHIVRLFLVEALLLGIIGGLLGALFGIFLSIIINLSKGPDVLFTVIGSNISVFGGIILFCLLLSVILTLAATYLPAKRASGLSPAEALRYEN